MNEKDLFKGINLLKEECERSGNSLVVNVWHKKSDLEMTVLCGDDGARNQSCGVHCVVYRHHYPRVVEVGTHVAVGQKLRYAGYLDVSETVKIDRGIEPSRRRHRTERVQTERVVYLEAGL